MAATLVGVALSGIVAAGPAAASIKIDGRWAVDRVVVDTDFEVAPAAVLATEEALIALSCSTHGAGTLFLRWPDVGMDDHAQSSVTISVPGFGSFDVVMQLEGGTLTAPVYEWRSATPMMPVGQSIVSDDLVAALARGLRAEIAVEGEAVLDLSLRGSLRAINALRGRCP